MNIFDRIKSFFTERRNKGTVDTTDMNNLLSFLGIDRNQDTKSLNEATYFACLKVLSESIAKMPLKLLRYNDKNGVETMRKHDLYEVVHSRPNPYMTASTFWGTVEYNRNHYGNAYVWIQGGGRNTRLWILPTDDVEVWYDNGKILAEIPDIYYIYSAGGHRYVFGSEEVMHFKTFNSFDGIMGVSVRNQLKSTIHGAAKSQDMLNKMYSNGMTAKAVLNYTGNLSEANVKSLTANLEHYAKGDFSEDGIENIIPIPLGFSLEPLNVNLADSQFSELRQYTALQIASAFGIKPYQIGDYTKSSYASAEAQQLSFYVDTLLYIIKQYEEEISYKLLTPNELRKGYHFKFNVNVILRADLSTQIDTLSKGVSNFIYTPNEARAMLDLEAKEGGDELLGNGASIPVRMAGEQYRNSDETEDEGGDDDE